MDASLDKFLPISPPAAKPCFRTLSLSRRFRDNALYNIAIAARLTHLPRPLSSSAPRAHRQRLNSTTRAQDRSVLGARRRVEPLGQAFDNTSATLQQPKGSTEKPHSFSDGLELNTAVTGGSSNLEHTQLHLDCKPQMWHIA